MDDLIYIANYYKLNYIIFKVDKDLVFALCLYKYLAYNVYGTHWYETHLWHYSLLDTMLSCFINGKYGCQSVYNIETIIKKEVSYDYRN